VLRRTLSITCWLALLLSSFASAQEKKFETLIVSYRPVTGNRAPYWIAKELGLYEK
jgi:ABC-type nitrate/sulfonate/bicarbonate transport system substrate-binding protein